MMAAKTPASKKAKGRQFEKEISAMYRRKLDPKAEPMPMSGAMMNHKGDIFKGQWDTYSDECKWQENWSIHEWWEQAVSQCSLGQAPVLHMRRSHEKPRTMMWTDDYFNLREENMDLKEEIKRLEGEISRIQGTAIRPITKESQVKGLKRRTDGKKIKKA